MHKRYGSDELKTFLIAIDKYLKQPADILIIGGTAAALGYKVSRRTQDIDTLTPIDMIREAYEEAKSELNLQIPIEMVTVADAPFHFEDRLQTIDLPTQLLKIRIPEIHDLILMKIVRGYEHDLEAIVEMADKNVVDLKTLKQRFSEEMNHVIGDPKKLKLNFQVMMEELSGDSEK